MDVPNLAIRSGTGVELWKPVANFFIPNEQFVHDESKNCRAFVFSPDGRYFAWVNGLNVQICTTHDWKVVSEIPKPKSYYLKFSPKSTYLTTWEIFAVTKSDPTPKPNLHIFNSATGEEVFSSIQKRVGNWEPFWSYDEATLSTMVGGEVLFFDVKGERGFTKAAKKLGGAHNGSFSLAPNSNVAFYVPGTKGAPSSCKIYKYPNFEQAIAQKSFFQADNIEIKWNKKGSGVLLLTSTEVDASGVSYYGKQALHFLTIKGDSCTITLPAEGPIHAVEWSPKSTEFCVCYGFMPANATMFNMKGDAVFEFDLGIRNSIYFNDFGNLILFGGFGNLRGNVEIWDCVKKQKISSTVANDTTLLQWSPCGDKYFTATTAPRLRMSNGFKIWHYSGALLYEKHWPTGQELLELTWQKLPSDKVSEPVISAEKVEGIQSSVAEPSKQKYVPPCIRDNLISVPGAAGTGAKRLPPGMTLVPEPTKPNKTPRNRNRNTKNGDTSNEVEQPSQNNGQKPNPTARAQQPQQRTTENGNGGDNDGERSKRIKSINTKLKDIKKLKEKAERGEKLDHNQNSKVSTEAELIKELKTLKVTA